MPTYMNDAKQIERRNRKVFSYEEKYLAHHVETPKFQDAPMPSVGITDMFRKF